MGVNKNKKMELAQNVMIKSSSYERCCTVVQRYRLSIKSTWTRVGVRARVFHIRYCGKAGALFLVTLSYAHICIS